jgi:hypothetical protein
LTDAISYFFFFAAAFFFGAAFFAAFLVAFFIVDSPDRNLRSSKKSQRDSYIELLEKKVKQKIVSWPVVRTGTGPRTTQDLIRNRFVRV